MMVDSKAEKIVHEHGKGYRAPPEDLEQKSSGLSKQSMTFMKKLQIEPSFDIESAACCWSYLVNQRQYKDGGDDDVYDGVKFGKCMGTKCYIDGPQGNRGVNCVVKTGHDYNLGEIRNRSVCQSHSYQLYLKPNAEDPVMALGVMMNVRIEAIAVGKIRKQYNSSKLLLQLLRCQFARAVSSKRRKAITARSLCL